MKNTIKVFLTAVCLSLLMAVPVLADGGGGYAYLKFGDVEITELDKDASGAGWSYDADMCTIVLENYHGGTIEFCGYYTYSFDVDIILKGSNTIEGCIRIFMLARDGSADVSFFGDGSLSVKGSDFVTGYTSLAVNGGSISCTCEQQGFRLPGLVLNGGTLELKNTHPDSTSRGYNTTLALYSYDENIKLNGGTLIISNETNRWGEDAFDANEKLEGEWTAYDASGSVISEGDFHHAGKQLNYIRFVSKQHVTGCNPGSWQIVKAPTSAAEGKAQRICTVCKQVTAEKAIPKLTGQSAAEEPSGLKKGDTFTDTKTKAVYKVTKAGAEAAYQKPSVSKPSTVTVPATVKVNGVTYKVTSIAANACKKNTKLTKVTIGSNVTSIGSSAFNGCTKLKTVTFGKKLKTIGTSAFSGCKALKKVSISSASLTKIGDSAFFGCTSMTSFTASSKKLTTIGKKAFYGDKKLGTITLKSEKLTKAKVGANAFKGIKATAKIKVPSKKLSAYKKALKGKGQGSKVKIVKL